MKSIVRIGTHACRPHCPVVRSFKCGRAIMVKSRIQNKSLPSFLLCPFTHRSALSVMAKPPFHNEGNNEIDPSKGKGVCRFESRVNLCKRGTADYKTLHLHPSLSHGQTMQQSLWIICPRSCSIHGFLGIKLLLCLHQQLLHLVPLTTSTVLDGEDLHQSPHQPPDQTTRLSLVRSNQACS